MISISSCLCECLCNGCSNLIDSSEIEILQQDDHEHDRVILRTSVRTSTHNYFNEEKFVCCCFPLNRYFLWFHPSLSESSVSPEGQHLIYKYETGNTQAGRSLTPFCPFLYVFFFTHTACITLHIFEYINVATLLLF